MTDADLEAAIDREYLRMVAAEKADDQRRHFNRMRYLIGLRSPERVAEMERGLRG